MFVSAFSVSRLTAILGYDMTNAAPNNHDGQHEAQPWHEMEGKKPYEQGTYIFALWVMGGTMGVWKKNEYPWLREENTLIREVVECRGRP